MDQFVDPKMIKNTSCDQNAGETVDAGVDNGDGGNHPIGGRPENVDACQNRNGDE